jgi:hypothetical protein
MSRMDVIVFRQGKDKKFAHKIGSAMRKDDGSISVWLDSLPLPDERGTVNMVIQVPRERDSAPSRGDGYADRGRASQRPLDDDVPF